jgi:hypothetical protein
VVKARKEVRVPAGKTVAITACGKPTEMIAFTSNDLS